ncbi:MAG: PD-(D/E)XK nuclease family protein [Betaproteobacteria bacterium]|nr:PD-(D/E)XK nuclease family protein [Betaproteobacteria bacterium]
MPRAPRFSPRSEAALQPVLAALAAGATVVTANNRAAAWLTALHDAAQSAAGHAAWPTPRVVPWPAWVRGIWRALWTDTGGARAQVLSARQVQRLWTSVIAASAQHADLHNANAGALAAGAWEVVHGWQGQWAQWGGAAAREEHRAFVGWAEAFVRECAAHDWIDAARLPLLLADAVQSAGAGGMAAIGLYGFAELSPQQRSLADALRAAGVSVTEFAAPGSAAGAPAQGATRLPCADPADEWRRCAHWCRDWLVRDADATLGVVIPDLAAQRPLVERIFREVLAPGTLLAGDAPDLPFNISHADPLAWQPLVNVALTLLGWAQAPIGLVELAALARSPHIAGHDHEWPARAALVRDLMEEPRDSWLAAELAQFTRRRCPAWSAQLSALATHAAAWRRRRPAKEWRQAWEDALAAAGWLAAGSLDSVEHQARGAWNDALDGWMRDESISGRMTPADAFSSLGRLIAETPFQPERGQVPVQILGTLEASGLYFDGLWVCGLTAERWPAAPQPSPLLPLAWQRMVGAPHASAERELRYHRELTAQFADAAPVVIFSWPQAIDGIPAAPSPLLAEFATEAGARTPPDAAPPVALQMALAGVPAIWEDAHGLPLDPGSPAKGRVALVEAQANCPFQAYAAFRLQAEPWPQRSEGLTPAERGSLVHYMLAAFWEGLPDQAALHALEGAAWHARCAGAVDAALGTLPPGRWQLLGDTFRNLERERLLGLLREWLAIEVERPPFAVAGTESKRSLNIDGLELRLKVDRIDRVGEGQYAVIDFKTGISTILDLQRDGRLVAPQLPLYAEALAPDPVVAVAYASVRRGESKVAGLAATTDIWDALKAAEPDWTATRARWRAQLHGLVEEYRRGVATVDPWRYPGTCARCGRHALCRINEHVAFLESDGEGGGAGAENGGSSTNGVRGGP